MKSILINEGKIDQEGYIARFKQTKGGKRQCNKTAKRLRKLQKHLKNDTVSSMLHTQNCTGPEKVLYCTLNFQALGWVRKDNVNCEYILYRLHAKIFNSFLLR